MYLLHACAFKLGWPSDMGICVCVWLMFSNFRASLCVCECACVYIMYVHVYPCLHTCTLCTDVCVCVCECVCLCVCVCVSVCVCVCVYYVCFQFAMYFTTVSKQTQYLVSPLMQMI